MIAEYPVITLCGSTKFKEEFQKAQKELTLNGCIVISVGLFGHSGDIISDEDKIMLDDMHKRKIDMADGIYVVNVGGYIGSSTKSEIKYAKEKGKYITYLETNKIKEFPVLGTQETVPWSVIEPHENQAIRNHGQTIKRLAERGGLDYSEMLAVLEDRPYKKMELYHCRMMVLKIISDLNRILNF